MHHQGKPKEQLSSRLRIESHFDVHAHLHGVTIFHGGAEPPLLQRADRILIQLPGKRSDNADNPGDSVFLDYRVEHDGSGLRRAFSRCIWRIDPVNDSWRHDARTYTRRHVICNRLIKLRITQAEFNGHLGCRFLRFAASLAWSEFPLADSEQRIFIESKSKPLHDPQVPGASIDTYPHFHSYYSFDATVARFIAV